jgi:dihydroflavonol-4-reductase
VTIGEARGQVADEWTPHRGSYLSWYERTKAESEKIALTRSDVDVVSVNPSSVQGPGRASGTGRLVLAAARGRLPVMVDTAISIVDIDDCARGHLLAAEKGVPGERYLLSGATMGTREALRILAEVTGRPSRARFIEPRALTLAGAIGGVVARLGVGAGVCPESARVILHGHRYDGSRATRELGLSYTPVGETLRRAVDWFEEQGLTA